ncbi:MAG: hypothetical protein AABP62_23935 [Planctomycetota bacterium]
MTPVSHLDDAPALPDLQGHTVGFVDTLEACEALTQALKTAGFPEASIKVLRGEEGLHLLERMVDASSWGESAEEVLKLATVELPSGHSLVFVDVQNAEEATTVAEVSTQHGAHGTYHFGLLVDTRLTA